MAREKKDVHVAESPHGVAMITDLSQEALALRVAKISAKLDEIDALLEDAVELTDEQRAIASRMRGPEEESALSSVLDYAEANSGAFVGLAPKDGGNDPMKFETELLRRRLAVAGMLGKLAGRFDSTRLAVSDSALHATTLARPVVLAAYEIAKPLAKHDTLHGQKLNAALNYYGGIARASVKTRKANRAAATPK